ncbi:MAG: helix-turn-helix transcriptional regulator [Bacteroidota bacterium]
MRKSYSKKDSELLKKVGQKIRGFRLKSGLSQEKLAFASNLDRTYIGSVERGERNISIINLEKISSALNINSFELLKIEE